LSAARTRSTRIVGAISAAHFVSHYYLLLLAPLLPAVRADFGVSYTEIGFALAAFNIVSSVLQIPMGFLVDRLGARMLLIGGLLIGALAFIVAGMTGSFWLFVAMFAVAGIGNTVYHPADYALLSHHVPSERIGQAFSVHTFAGMLGGAVAPASLLFMQNLWGWRGAFIGAGIIGLAAALLVLLVREYPAGTSKPQPAGGGAAKKDSASWSLLLSTPILANLVFFMLLAMMNAGISNYSVVALGAGYGTPVTIANAALTGYLMMAALGVLAGGILVVRTERHALVAAIGLLLAALLTAVLAETTLTSLPLIALLSTIGFVSGVIMPSRDMIVRAATPAGSFGKVFGFVTTGFNVGGIIAPLLFGAVMDHGSPHWVFLVVAVLSALGIFTVMTSPRRQEAAD
jgi:MFS family permease